MKDPIERQAAIEVFADAHPLDYNAQSYLAKIKALPPAEPEITLEDIKKYCEKRGLVILTSELYNEMKSRCSSAKPEIIRCKDCVYFTPEKSGEHWNICRFYDAPKTADGFCNDAERKEE